MLCLLKYNILLHASHLLPKMVAESFFDPTPLAFTHDVPSPFVPTAHQKQAMKWQSMTFLPKARKNTLGSMQRLDFGNVQNGKEKVV